MGNRSSFCKRITSEFQNHVVPKLSDIWTTMTRRENLLGHVYALKLFCRTTIAVIYRVRGVSVNYHTVYIIVFIVAVRYRPFYDADVSWSKRERIYKDLYANTWFLDYDATRQVSVKIIERHSSTDSGSRIEESFESDIYVEFAYSSLASISEHQRDWFSFYNSVGKSGKMLVF